MAAGWPAFLHLIHLSKAGMVLKKRLTGILILCAAHMLLIPVLLSGCSKSADESITSLGQLEGKRIGVQTGTTAGAVVRENLPNYVILRKASIPATWVSIIGFTFIFGTGVITMLQTGVGAVDRGQMEAACALGYTDRHAFFRIILPQTIQHILPGYIGQITSLLKATAIVGYIAVLDLTKMGDIIRSRTYEAFFPLISVAVIYFVLAWILTFIVEKIGRFLDVRRRKGGLLLKGVKIHE